MGAKTAKQAAVGAIEKLVRGKVGCGCTHDMQCKSCGDLDDLFGEGNEVWQALTEYETAIRASLLSEIEKKVVGAKKKCAKNHMTVVGHGCDGCPETTGGTCAKYIERIIKEAQEGE